MNFILSGDTLFHLAFLTPLTSTPTLPSTLFPTSLCTANSLDNLFIIQLQCLCISSTYSDFTTLQLTPLLLSFVILSYSFLCRYISVATPPPTMLQTQLFYSVTVQNSQLTCSVNQLNICTIPVTVQNSDKVHK